MNGIQSSASRSDVVWPIPPAALSAPSLQYDQQVFLGGAQACRSTFVHGGQALMAWAVSNARVEPKGNAIFITKQASGTAKIDPLMAAFNAIAWMSANPASSQPSIIVI